MISRGVTQQAKIAVNYVQNFFFMPRSPSSTGNCTTICLAKTLDFDLIEYLALPVTMHTENAAGSTYSVKIGSTTEINQTLSDAETGVAEIDCTSYTGTLKLSILINSDNVGDTSYLTDWGYYTTEGTISCIA